MVAEKRFSMGVFIPNDFTHKLDLRIVRHFKIINFHSLGNMES